MEELCSPGSPQGTRDRRDTNKLCRLAFPKSRHLDKSFGLFFFHFPSSFLFFSVFFKARGQAKEPVLSSCLQPCVTIPSLMILLGTTNPKSCTTLMLSFCPARWTQLIFTFDFPAWKRNSTKKRRLGFFPIPPSMSSQGKDCGGTRVEQLPNCSSEHHSGYGDAPRNRRPLDQNKTPGPFLILILRSKDFPFLWTLFHLCAAARPLGPSPVLCCWLPS